MRACCSYIHIFIHFLCIKVKEKRKSMLSIRVERNLPSSTGKNIACVKNELKKLSLHIVESYKLQLHNTLIMEFCSICQNMLYMKTEEGGSLVRYCKHCGNNIKTEANAGQALKVSSTMYSEDKLLFVQHQNPYLRFDPTLPRIRDPAVQCPSKTCTGPRDAPQVVYVKYHPVHMNYLYCCDYCGETWAAGEGSRLKE